MSDNIIRELTPEQEANLEVVKQKWKEIGVSTSPCDKEKGAENIKKVYQITNLEPPSTVLYVKSPVQGCVVAYLLKHDLLENYKTITYDELQVVIKEFLTGDLTDKKTELKQFSYQCGYGNHDAGWLCFYDIFTGVNEDVEKLRALIDFANDGNWWWGFRDCAVVSEKPIFILLDEEGRLHHESRSALEWRDGFEIFVWHGVKVDKDIILHPENITKEQIFKAPNQEIRRVLIERFGMHNLLTGDDVKLIHKDVYGELVEYTGFAYMEGEDDTARFVKVIDHSTDREYALRVPAEIETAKAAVAWTFDMEEEDYNPKTQT